jgi:hypothetical protein
MVDGGMFAFRHVRVWVGERETGKDRAWCGRLYATADGRFTTIVRFFSCHFSFATTLILGPTTPASDLDYEKTTKVFGQQQQKERG